VDSSAGRGGWSHDLAELPRRRGPIQNVKRRRRRFRRQARRNRIEHPSTYPRQRHRQVEAVATIRTNTFVVGQTDSANFPDGRQSLRLDVQGKFRRFVAKLDSGGFSILYARGSAAR
jgi:hypothetical protein